jgi:hypothetical protein
MEPFKRNQDAMLKFRLLKLRKKISWLLLILSYIVFLSGYAQTVFNIQENVMNTTHVVLGVIFAIFFLLHTAISVFLIRFEWRKTLQRIFSGGAGDLLRLRFMQRLSGWLIVAFAGLTLLSGLEWFKIGLGRFVPFSVHIWNDLFLWLAIAIHGSIGLSFWMMRRSKSSPKTSARFSASRRQAITMIGGMFLSVLAIMYLDRVSLVSRTIEYVRNVLPPNQYQVSKLRVLNIEPVPSFDEDTWSFEIYGLVRNPMKLSYSELKALPRTTSVSDFHCVTGWTKFDNKWEGVTLSTLMNIAKPLDKAKYALVFTDQPYTTSLPLGDLRRNDVLLAYRLDDMELPTKYGGPLRLVVPHKYGYKSAKWVRGIKFIEEHELGYWEVRGYSDTADPFTNDRYS